MSNDENRTETETAPAAAPRLSKADLMAALSELSPAEKRALLGSPAAEQSPGTPKMSPAIDAIAPAERAAVMKACGDVLRVQTDPKAMGAAFAQIQQRWPELAVAITNNSAYRGKTLGHSLRVVVDALNRKGA